MTKIMAFLAKSEKTLCVAFMVICFFIVMTHITGRYIFNYPLYFAEEAARFLFVYLVMIAMSAVLRSDSHIRAEYFINFLPSKAREFLEIILDLLALCFVVIIIYTGFQIVAHTFNALSPALSISIGLIYLAAPLSAMLMCLTLIIRLIDKIRHLGR